MELQLRLQALEDRVADLEKTKPSVPSANTIGFNYKGTQVLSMTVDKKFYVDGQETRDIDKIIQAFTLVARQILKATEPTKSGIDA